MWFSLIFDIRHSIWMLDLVWYSIFNIRFECWIEFDIRYSTFKIWMLNVEYRTSNQILIAFSTPFLWGTDAFTTTIVRTGHRLQNFHSTANSSNWKQQQQLTGTSNKNDEQKSWILMNAHKSSWVWDHEFTAHYLDLHIFVQHGAWERWLEDNVH